MSKTTARLNDQLGRDPETFPILNSNYSDTMNLEEGATKVFDRTLGNAWIVGSPTNGIVGPNTSTQGRGQQVVGGDGRIETVLAVVNFNNTYIEQFEFDVFEDKINTTGLWSANGLALESGEKGYSDIIALTGITFTSATLNTDNEDSDLTYYLSADDGTTWEEVTPNVLHSFTVTGTKLRWRVDSTSTQTITKIIVSY